MNRHEYLRENRQIKLTVTKPSHQTTETHSVRSIAPRRAAATCVTLPRAHMGTAKDQSSGLFPHTCGRGDPIHHPHTTPGLRRQEKPTSGTGRCARLPSVVEAHYPSKTSQYMYRPYSVGTAVFTHLTACQLSEPHRELDRHSKVCCYYAHMEKYPYTATAPPSSRFNSLQPVLPFFWAQE